MSELLTFVFLVGYVVVILYGIAYVMAVVMPFVAWMSADLWTIDEKDPLSAKSKTGVLRKLEAMEMVTVGRAGAPRFAVIAMSGRRLTVDGLQDKRAGMRYATRADWKIRRVPDNETYKPTIQSTWWILSPLYVFRVLTYGLTGRHVVRVFVPFFLFGFYAYYEPVLMEHVRARSRARAKTRHMYVKDNLGGLEVSPYEIVSSMTDHVLEQWPHRTITAALPTRDGFSIRMDYTITLRVDNLLDWTVWKDATRQIASVVANATGTLTRVGSLDEVYAAVRGKGETAFQERVLKYLRNIDDAMPFRDADGRNVSVLKMVGLDCLQVSLNDVVPADKETQQEIRRIMAIPLEQTNIAIGQKLTLEKQLEALNDKDENTVRAMASITAAQKIGEGKGRTDFIIYPPQNSATPGPGFGDVMQKRTYDALRDKDPDKDPDKELSNEER